MLYSLIRTQLHSDLERLVWSYVPQVCFTVSKELIHSVPIITGPLTY